MSRADLVDILTNRVADQVETIELRRAQQELLDRLLPLKQQGKVRLDELDPGVRKLISDWEDPAYATWERAKWIEIETGVRAILDKAMSGLRKAGL